ncbi:discoidin domain-containing protein [Streptomyces endophyticus]|uniref:Discoidin domain-containing protein n=1 Tax=Streptomyces endophyticus TaxID=714166 RepID=A0ABU6FC97_9ACTN|nr:discoidin domain-containing protein [Streptomyces endophyticus]MEB8341098.1 discoidin domain-containing protein [Streptomyces endophyticus]
MKSARLIAITAVTFGATLVPPAHAAPAVPGCGGPGWTLGTRTAAPENHAYAGNGYLGVRVPPVGSGYTRTGEKDAKTGWPLYTPPYDGAFVSGLYGRGPRNTAHREAIAALPTWTALDVQARGETYGPDSRTTGYRQTLDMRCGVVRTEVTWVHKDGKRTDLTFEVLADRADPHVGAVRLRVRPHWSGDVTVTDRIDERGARRITGTGSGPAGKRTAAVGFRTDGSGTAGTVASTLRSPGRTHTARHADDALGTSQSADFSAVDGGTYDVTKYVGVDTALTSKNPRADALRASKRAAAAGWDALTLRHNAAWRELWAADVETPGRPELQSRLRAAQYGLLSSLRPGARNSIGPTGLSSDNYAGMVFWDAETWMYPSLLATRPELAKPVLEYRYRTRGAAADNALKTSQKGFMYPWTSASSGSLWKECQSWNPPHCVTQNHLQGDIALAAWQYYQATGDRAWLRERGWPLLKGLATYWSSRVTPNEKDGTYSIKDVAGPDEYSNGVDDGVYTNAVAATSLRSAAKAAALVGERAPADWNRIADRLRIPYDSKRKVFLQYAGYDIDKGADIKQADAVLLLYPLDWKPMPKGAAAATLDYYAAHTDRDGPAMTDSVHAVAAAGIGEPGCSTYTFLERASRPFFRGPFGTFSESRGEKAGAGDALAGTPAQDFLTGKGGFLQVFTHGLTGMRLQDDDAVRLDPMLPPQLSTGVKVKGLQWRGRTYDVGIGARNTTVRLTSGAPFTVDTPGGRHTVTGAGLTLPTRRPDLTPTTDLARCKSAKATSEDPGQYAGAAVDGNPATTWHPAAPGASLTVDLGGVRPVDRVEVAGTKAYRLETSADGKGWAPFEAGAGADGRYVRLTETGESAESVGELTVS